MFSALKRLTGKADGGVGGVSGMPCPRPGLQAMSHSLQRKFARGVQYNMKIIIKGDRNVGKTCLFHRLQGGKFVEEYIPTEEIQVASIQWSYKATEDVVKVEVWDVVDHGRKRRQLRGLKLGPDCTPGGDDGKEGEKEDAEETAALDAQFLDVYKGTNGVVLMMDVTKSWTFDYVTRELPKIPHHIPVLVLANHCDMGHHRTVTADTVTYFIEGLNRSPGSVVRYAESSMRNGFGLRLLHRFLNVPFLKLQRDTLEAQLATNARETDLTIAELDLYQSSDEADYDKFLENLTSRRRAAAENTGIQSQSFSSHAAPAASTNANGTSPPQQPGLHPSHSTHALSSATSARPAPPSNMSAGGTQGWKQGQSPWPEPLGTMRKSSSVPGPSTASLLGLASACSNTVPTHPKVADVRPPTGTGKPEPLAKTAQFLESRTTEGVDVQCPADKLGAAPPNGNHGSTMEMSHRKASKKELGHQEGIESSNGKCQPSADPIFSLDEFVPDGGGVIDRSFLEDDSKQPLQIPVSAEQESDEDSDTGKGNPLVAGFQDDLDSDYENSVTNQSRQGVGLPRPVDNSGDGSSPALSDEENGRPLSMASGREGSMGNKPSYVSRCLLDAKPPSNHLGLEDLLCPVSAKHENRWSKKSSPDIGDLGDGFIKENNVSSDESLTIPSTGIKVPACKEKVKKLKEKGDEKSSKKHKKGKSKKKAKKKAKKKGEEGDSGREEEEEEEENQHHHGLMGRHRELEEFLNGSPASPALPEAYEAL